MVQQIQAFNVAIFRKVHSKKDHITWQTNIYVFLELIEKFKIKNRDTNNVLGGEMLFEHFSLCKYAIDTNFMCNRIVFWNGKYVLTVPMVLQKIITRSIQLKRRQLLFLRQIDSFHSRTSIYIFISAYVSVANLRWPFKKDTFRNECLKSDHMENCFNKFISFGVIDF